MIQKNFMIGKEFDDPQAFIDPREFQFNGMDGDTFIFDGLVYKNHECLLLSYKPLAVIWKGAMLKLFTAIVYYLYYY